MDLILYLNQKKKTTLSELSEQFEVSKRTIMRDLDAISALGIPVYTQQGSGGGVSSGKESLSGCASYYAVRADGMVLCAADGQKKYFFPLSEITSCTATNQEFEWEQFKKFL